jgi:hypothetical protein
MGAQFSEIFLKEFLAGVIWNGINPAARAQFADVSAVFIIAPSHM